MGGPSGEEPDNSLLEYGAGLTVTSSLRLNKRAASARRPFFQTHPPHIKCNYALPPRGRARNLDSIVHRLAATVRGTTTAE
jgi:hypothetical protein